MTYERAADLDRALGDPRDPANPCGFEAMVRRDAEAAYPQALAARAALLRTGLLPGTAMDELLMLVRVAGRRDVTVMPATLYSVTAATCVLLAGDERQREEVLRLIEAGEQIGFALSEAEHGADLLANQCRLERGESGFRLHGRKWLVGAGRRCSALLVVARSGGRGPSAFSAVLVRGAALERARVPVPALPSAMRGADFGGFAFDHTELPADALVGEPSRGLEIAMKAMQVVRTTSTAANLACADTGLRLTMDFAAAHHFGGRPLLEHGHVRRELGTAFAALLACDVVAITAARALHTLPGAQSLWASVAKKVLTELSEEVFTRCADVLGTRAVLDGPFSVARRDNQLVRFIDTGPVANLRLVCMQLRQLAAAEPEAQPSTELATTYTIDRPLPTLRLADLALSNRGRDEVTAALPAIDSRVAAELKLWRQDVRALAPGEDCQDLAERFCFLHAAASCLHLTWFTPALGESLAPSVDLLLDRAAGGARRLSGAAAESAASQAEGLHARGHLFSVAPLPLAEGSSTPWLG
ncbi:acyl-CoA dehydrogenase [Kutzneria viridogrisea]|uniref:Alkylation response protein AidB-like acyl-CoA dehydrogenase n=1 Tax=Kutzneria viridogrisea TaxID=47990 RepID=A0ABR6BBY8_9PSEU|nr:alkylation response protein AidB-like acyl-CoA dehydrogenase [Kutzneria viridogrisea]